MQNINLYPELVDYIYSYEAKFMTEDEKTADRTFIYNAKTSNERMLEMMKQKGWISEDERIKNMLADGFDAFKIMVVTRIYTEHKNELVLNLCPKCGKIARTPLAKQCRFCFNNWHC